MVPGFPRERCREALSVETSPKVSARIRWYYSRRNLIGLQSILSKRFFLRQANYSLSSDLSGSLPPIIQNVKSRNGNTPSDKI